MFNMFGYSAYAWISAVLAVITIGIVILLKYIARNDDYWKKRGVPYNPRRNFFQIMKILKQQPLHELQLHYYKKQEGKIMGGFESSKPMLSISDPDLLRDVLVKDFNTFPFRREFKVGEPMDSMVSILKGEDWKRVRTIITPAFTSKRMRQMSSIINDCSKSVVSSCEKYIKDGKPIDCKATFGAFSMDVIASAAFATKINSHDDPQNEFVKAVKDIFREPSIWNFVLALIIPVRLFKFFGIGAFKPMEFFKDITVQVINERKKTGKKYNDILQILMDAANENVLSEESELNEDEEDKFGSINSGVSPSVKFKRISENELLAQCVLFFFVGYETTAGTMAFMAYLLALNPEWQEKLISEVDEAFKKYKEMSYDAVRDMKILDAVVSETLRMYPALILSERTAVEDYKLGNTGIIIEKGMRINFPIYSMHYDPDYFEDPETFNPNRFISSNENNHPQYAYLPFGAGPRNCLGMRFALLEIKLGFTNILRHFRFRTHATTKIPLEFKKASGFLSVDELPLALEKRNDL